MTPDLRRYLDLEKVMIALDAVDERAADAVRDVMDDLWYALSDAERGLLDARSTPSPVRVFEEVRLPAPSTLFRRLEAPEQRTPRGPLTDWRRVA